MFTVLNKVGFISIVIFSFFHLTRSQWLQSSSELNATSFSFLDSFTLAGTRNQGIYISVESNSWEQACSGLPVEPDYPSSFETVNALAVGKENVFAAIHGKGVFHIAEDGETWESGNDGLPKDQYGSIYVYTLTTWGTILFAGTEDGGMYHSTDGGLSWAPFDTGLPITPYSPIWSLADNGTYLFASTDSGVYRTEGKEWTEVSTGLPKKSYRYIRSLTSHGTYLFAGGGGGTAYGVFLSKDNGSTWTAANNGLPSNVTITSLASFENFVFAGTEYDGIFMTENNGKSWTALNLGFPQTASLVGVRTLAVNKTDLYAAMIFYVKDDKNNKFIELYSLWHLSLKSITSTKYQRQLRNDSHLDLKVACRFDRTVNISFNLSKPQKVLLEIFDISGKKLATLDNISPESGTHYYQYRVSSLSSGCYLVRLKTNISMTYQKIRLP